MTSDLIKELLEAAEAMDAAAKMAGGGEQRHYRSHVCRRAADHIASLEAALAPFAKEALEENGEPRQDWKFAPDNELIPGHCELTYGDFRRAARALSGEAS